MSRLITQRAIVAAFKDMLKDTPFNKITIGDLSDRTGVNRQTFYYNFRDIYDLTLFMFEDELFPLIENERDFSDCMGKINDYFYEHRNVVLNISRHINRDEIKNRLQPVIRKIASNMIDDVTKSYPLKSDDRAIAVDFTTLMIFEFILGWIDKGVPEQKERFSRFADILEHNMKSTVKFLHGDA